MNVLGVRMHGRVKNCSSACMIKHVDRDARSVCVCARGCGDDRLVGEQSCGLDAHGHVRNHERDGLVVGDWDAHCLSLRRVSDRLVHGAASEPDRARSNWRAGVVKRAHRHLEAVADVAEAVLVEHQHVLKGDSARVRAALPHIDLLTTNAYAWRVGVHDEAGESGAGLGLGVSLCEDEVPVGDAAVGDPHLLAVNKPRVAFALRACSEPGYVGACARLRHAVGSLQRLLGQPAQVLHLLLVRARKDHGRLGQAVGLHRRHDAGAAVRELLADDDALHAAEAEAAILLGNVRVHQAHLPSLVEHRPRELHRPIVLGRDRDNLLCSKCASCLLQGILLL
mmetsp:Transcript_17461/g.37550  ORF Transcript_17461/g.37550 Transcript_17461/m.37550 type:complete len:338 (+) Transcript_17461:1186-2199(+)